MEHGYNTRSKVSNQAERRPKETYSVPAKDHHHHAAPQQSKGVGSGQGDWHHPAGHAKSAKKN
jgi:hypothetical protein